MNPRFVQIHALTSYPASLLNRDDAGFAKRLPFGGATRTRISSQCLKRHWRTHDGAFALASIGELAVRSRRSFEAYVLQPLLEKGIDRERALPVVEALMAEVLGKSEKAKVVEGEATVRTGQVTVLGLAELRYLREVAEKVLEVMEPKTPVAKALKEVLDTDGKKNLKAMGNAGLDAAMFGRMVTGDVLAQTDAAVHVAHAFTVHEEASEPDYFSAVDELAAASDEDRMGSGHIGSTELTTGLFYSYAVVDVPLLVSNLTGVAPERWLEADRTDAARVLDHLVRIIATVSPGAKLGSTAPHAYAQAMVVETGDAQPRTLANAFLKPVTPRPDLLANAYQALATHARELDEVYGAPTDRRWLGVGPKDALGYFGEHASLDQLAGWAAEQVKG